MKLGDFTILAAVDTRDTILRFAGRFHEQIVSERVETLDSLLRRAVEKNGDGCAISFGNEKIAYHELDKASAEFSVSYKNLLANEQDGGFRSPVKMDTTIALFALWRAGGVFNSRGKGPQKFEGQGSGEQEIMAVFDDQHVCRLGDILQVANACLNDQKRGNGKFLLSAPIDHLAFYWSLIAAVADGGELVIPASDGPEDTANMLIDHGITDWFCDPDRFAEVTGVILNQVAQKRSLENLKIRNITLSHGHPERDVLRQWTSSFDLEKIAVRYVLVDQYGCKPIAVRRLTSSYTGQSEAYFNIGNVLPSVNLWVLDGNKTLLPESIPGRLCISAGIHSVESDLTGFINADTTGHAAYWNDEGIFILSWNAFSHFFFGKAIDIASVEKDVVRMTGSDCAVIIHRDGLASLMLIFTASAESSDRIKGEWPQWRGRIEVVFVDKFPDTSDRPEFTAALLRRYQKMGNRRNEQGLSDIEQMLIPIWQEVLNVDDVSPDDDFFDLGGNSLKAPRLVYKIREKIPTSIGVRELFLHPTLAEFAAEVLRGAQSKSAPIEQADAKSSFVISPGQRRFYLLHQQEAKRRALNVASLYKTGFALNESALRSAIGTLMARHEILRTAFRTENGEPRQIILPASETAVPLECIPAEMEAKFEERSLLIFDLENPPLFRAVYQWDEKAGYGYLFLCFHHIVCDHQSLEVFFSELVHVYREALSGLQSSLTPLRIQYKDYAELMLQKTQSQEWQSSQEYWLDNLKDFNKLALPSRMRGQSEFAACAVTSLPLGIAGGVTLNGKKVSSYDFFLTAFYTLLYQYTKQQDLLVAAPFSLRDQPDFEKLVGFLVNTVVVRIKLDGEEAFTDLLLKVRHEISKAQAHAHFPFDRLVDAMGVDFDSSKNPLFDVMFSVQHRHQHDSLLSQFQAEIVPLPEQTSQFSMFVNVVEGDEGWHARFFYDPQVYEPQFIEQFARMYRHVVSIAADGNDMPVKKYASAYRDNGLASLQGLPPEQPELYDIIHYFSTIVAQMPDTVAIRHGEKTISYGELDSAADKVCAWVLLKGGIGAIAIHMRRTPEIIVAILGILKAGCYYVPLNPDEAAERLNLILNDCGARILLCDDPETMAVIAPSLTVYAGIQEILAKEAAAPALPVIRPSDLAYVTYTSGSSGVPKGVKIAHEAVVSLVKNTNYTEIGLGDRVLQFAPVYFDASVFEIFGPLLNGASLCQIETEKLLNPLAFRDYILHNDVNVAFLTTAFFNIITETVPDVLAHFDKLYFGGEYANVRIVEKAAKLQKHGGALIHVYGPTENTTFATFYPIAMSERFGSSVPIGKSVCGSLFIVLDAANDIALPFVAGEILLGGVKMSKGYLNRSTDAENSLLDNPFEAGKKLYRTGDLGFVRPDGNLEFIGRADSQIKINGHRIELHEIQHALERISFVDKAVVLNSADNDGAQRLIACWLGTDTPEEILRKELSKKLPVFMIPSVFCRVEAFPLNANGKIDLRKLSHNMRSAVSRSEVRMPVGLTQTMIMERWNKEIGDIRSVDDNFFEIGGNSLKAMKVIFGIYEDFQVNVDLRDFYNRPTIASMAEHIDEQRNMADSLAHFSAQRTSDMPLTRLQRDIWLSHSISRGKSNYNVSAAWNVAGRLDVARLKDAVAKTIASHDIFNTNFKIREGKLAVVENSRSEVPFTVLNTLAIPGSDDVTTFIEKQTDIPFNLENEFLCRAGLIMRNPEESVLYFIIHHIVCDGISLSILFSDIMTRYSNEFASADRIPYRFRDYVADCLQKREMSIENYRLISLRDYTSYSRGFSLDNLRGGELNGFRLTRLIDRSSALGLRTTAAKIGTSPFVLLLSVFSNAVGRLTTAPKLAVVATLSLREAPAHMTVVGPCMTVIPLYLKTTGTSWQNLIHSVNNVFLEMFSVRFCREFDQATSNTQPFSCAMVYHPLGLIPDQHFNADGLSFTPFPLPVRKVTTGIRFEVYELQDGFRFNFDFSCTVFSEEEAYRFMSSVDSALTRCIEDPGGEPALKN